MANCCRFWTASVLGVALLLVASRVFSQELNAPKRYEFSEEKMGVPTRLLFYAFSDEKATVAAQAVWERFDELNSILSDWDPESEIIQACRAIESSGERVAVSDDLRRALLESRKYCELTRGAFDSTVSPIVKLWRRSRYFHERPPAKMLDAAKERVGLNVWNLDDDGLWAEKGVRFDVGGVAKGIVLDEALRILNDHEITSALIDASGDLRIGDPPPDKDGWIVGVSSLGDEPAFYCELSNVGVATSGDANRYVEIDGVRYSHIIDPRTGEPLTSRCVATVLAPTATTADALASALCVLGPREAPEAFDEIRRQGVGNGELSPFDYILIEVADNPSEGEPDVETLASPRFRELFDAARKERTEALCSERRQ